MTNDQNQRNEANDKRFLTLIARLTAREHNRFFHFAMTSPERNNYGKVNLLKWEETKWQDSKAKADRPAI